MSSSNNWFAPTMKFMNLTAHNSSADLMATSTLRTTCSEMKLVEMSFVKRNSLWQSRGEDAQITGLLPRPGYHH
jgi:hypothetical protein